MSRPLPCGTPSMTSKRTMSPSSFKPESKASVPPICPAPTSAILLRAIDNPSDCYHAIVCAVRTSPPPTGYLREIAGVLLRFRGRSKRAGPSVATPGDVVVALHLDEARHRALKLEGAVAFDIESLGRRFGRHDEVSVRLVERV